MIPQFVEKFDAARDMLRAKFSEKHPEDYGEIVRDVVSLLRDPENAWDTPDPERITAIEAGSYQGTLIYVIQSGGYSPSAFWYTLVDYGSCSGCDTIEGIRGYSSKPPTAEQAAEYLTLALHIVQGIKPMGRSDPQ